MTPIVNVVECLGSKTAYCHAQLELPDKGRGIKGLVVYRAKGRFKPQLKDTENVSKWRGLEPEATYQAP